MCAVSLSGQYGATTFGGPRTSLGAVVREWAYRPTAAAGHGAGGDPTPPERPGVRRGISGAPKLSPPVFGIDVLAYVCMC